MEDATIGTKAEPAQPFDNPPAASPCRKSCAASVLIGAVLLILITLVVYSPIRHAGFIWDDDDYVTRNTTLSEPGGLARIWFKLGATPQYYPLVFSSFWIEHKLWAFNPLGYHCVNVVLHALSAVLVWLVLRRLALPGAWVAAAIFALHPVQAESVAWVTERKNVLSLVFALGSTLAWLGYLRIGDAHPERAHSRGLYVLSLVLFACALLSKTVVCTLPVVLGVVLWWKREKLRAGELLSLAPMLAMGAGMGLLTRWMEHRMVGAHGELFNFSFVERCLIAGRAAWFYFDKLVWPSKLVFIYERWRFTHRVSVSSDSGAGYRRAVRSASTHRQGSTGGGAHVLHPALSGAGLHQLLSHALLLRGGSLSIPRKHRDDRRAGGPGGFAVGNGKKWGLSPFCRIGEKWGLSPFRGRGGGAGGFGGDDAESTRAVPRSRDAVEGGGGTESEGLDRAQQPGHHAHGSR